MAIDKAVDSALLDNALAATAEKIREKTGSTEEIEFDMEKGTGFADAVSAIQTGSGSGDTSGEEILLTGNATEYSNAKATNLRAYALAHWKTLEKVSFPSVITVNGAYAMIGCTALKEVYMPKLETAEDGLFQDCTGLERVMLESLVQANIRFTYNCKSIKEIILPAVTMIERGAFNGCTSLQTVVLKSNTVCSLENVSAFTSTPFASGGTGGTVYVPSALIESYQTATNWSTLYAAGTCDFVAIEGSEYE